MANVRYPGTAGTTPGTITAADVTYDNTTSGLTADDVQEAIDEIESQIGRLSYDASDISYDNTTSGLTADDVQEALDEIDGNVDTLSGKVYKTDDSTETTIASDDLLPIYDTSATASKKITVANVVKATVSNPNLLDNPWFTVNQRGQSQYVVKNNYSVDRWRINNGESTVDVTDNGVTVTKTGTDSSTGLIQYIEPSRIVDNVGKTITLSIRLSDNTVKSYSAIIPTLTSTNNNIIQSNIDGTTWTATLCVRTPSNCFVIISTLTNDSPISIRAVKLEIGSVSTLAMDTAPNYATELLKCQRYFQRYNIADTVAWGCGHIYGSYAMVCRPLCCPMRTNPVLTVNGGLSACRLLVNGQGKVVIGLSIGSTGFTTNSVTMVVNTASSIGLDSYVAAVTLKPETDSTLSIDLSADL